jgi:hypothetical protein
MCFVQKILTIYQIQLQQCSTTATKTILFSPVSAFPAGGKPIRSDPFKNPQSGNTGFYLFLFFCCDLGDLLVSSFHTIYDLIIMHDI